MKKTLLIAAALFTAVSPVMAGARLSGAGASFPSKIYTRWFADLAKEKEGLRVNYQAVGSGSGRKAFIDETVNFGASDDPMKDKDIAKVKRGLVQIPMTGGTIAFGYNNPGCDLKVTQTQLADVFLGNITNWSEFGCDDRAISVVHRSDGSGTTAGFTSSLSAFSDEWKEKVGAGKAVAWPVGVGAKGNSGVAGTIKNRVGALGYVNYGYVLDGTLQQATIQNRAGNFVTANAETSAAGLGQIKLDSKLRGSDPNPAGANSYPIVSLTWALARPEHPNNDTMKGVFNFMLSDEAQSMSDSLGYVPLPQSIREQAREVVSTLK